VNDFFGAGMGMFRSVLTFHKREEQRMEEKATGVQSERRDLRWLIVRRKNSAADNFFSNSGRLIKA
jgi:hypothetical protein